MGFKFNLGVFIGSLILGILLGFVAWLGGIDHTKALYIAQNFPDVNDLTITAAQSWKAYLFALNHPNWIAMILTFSITVGLINISLDMLDD